MVPPAGPGDFSRECRIGDSAAVVNVRTGTLCTGNSSTSDFAATNGIANTMQTELMARTRGGGDRAELYMAGDLDLVVSFPRMKESHRRPGALTFLSLRGTIMRTGCRSLGRRRRVRHEVNKAMIISCAA